jgi:hypothetical protein
MRATTGNAHSISEIDAIFDFIPIRHYELIATITECQSLTSLSTAFLDEQYDWLLRWRELCERKRSTGVPRHSVDGAP